MDNFLEFILKDIEAKKTLDSTAPTKTKTNRKQLYDTLDKIEKKYINYQTNIRNYLFAKEKSLSIKSDSVNVDNIKDRIESLEKIKFLLNPANTYFEKMGFDILLYQINNYYVFNFNSLNKIINGLLEKFAQVGIALQSNDFTYTYYVNQYMSSYLEVYYNKSSNYSKVSEVFEQIYYMNPEIISHIELNFRKLIAKNENNFNSYIAKEQKKLLNENNVKDYNTCLVELKNLYNELIATSRESVSDIIELAKKGSIDIEQYLENNKVRKAAFNSVISENIDCTNQEEMDDICLSLEKLEVNINEYSNYLDFQALFNNFKEEYSKLLTETNDKKKENDGLKEIKITINKKEEELARINKKILSNKKSIFDFKGDSSRVLKIESVHKAKELYELYKVYDQEYFKSKVKCVLDKTLSIADLLNLYYSFDYFKKLAIKDVYNLKSYDEIVEYSKKFDKFANNLTNVVMPGVLVFYDTNIVRNIVNKYRLNNINILEEDLNQANLTTLLNKISLILRVNKINKSSTTVDKIWFITQVQKIKNKEEKAKEAN